MSTQSEVNKICQKLQEENKDISISSVQSIIGENYPFLQLAKKVLLFKKSPFLAKKIAEKDTARSKPEEHILSVIQKILEHEKVSDTAHLSLVLYDKFQSILKSTIESSDKKTNKELSQLQKKNQDIEFYYFSLRSKYLDLQKKFTALQLLYKQSKESTKDTSKKLNSIECYSIDTIIKNKIFRNYKTQLADIYSSFCAVYDNDSKQIIVKTPYDHDIVKEFRKGFRSIHLRANAFYDTNNKYWLISKFCLQTIELLFRNQFSFSKELSFLFQVLKKK